MHEDDDLARVHPSREQTRDLIFDPLGLVAKVGDLNNRNFARPLARQRVQGAGDAVLVHSDQCVRHLHHRHWAAVTIGHLQVGATGVEVLPLADAVGGGILEAVDRLVVVANDADLRRSAEVRDCCLLGLVEVLKLIDEQMLELLVLGRSGIVFEVSH